MDGVAVDGRADPSSGGQRITASRASGSDCDGRGGGPTNGLKSSPGGSGDDASRSDGDGDRARDGGEPSPPSPPRDNHHNHQPPPPTLCRNHRRGGLDNRTGKIKQIVEDSISAESKQTVLHILDEVNQLSMVEKLFLYLKLPTGKAAPVDPLRQPLNPLGSRFEIQQTITWIKTHLEEDPEVSLPKQDVYDEYLDYCAHNKMKPLSNADFGKVMKQVFPCVRPRRLGTRGNSRYCYSGMRKRVKLETPLLPDLGEHKAINHSEDEVVAAASCLIREWAEKLLSVRFDSLRDLACHLVDKMCVDSRSVAAFTLLSVTGGKCNGKAGSSSPLSLPSLSSSSSGQSSKHHETQLQLQRKLKEREMIREQKRKLQDQQQQQQQTAALPKSQVADKLKSKRAKYSSHLKDRKASTNSSTSSSTASSIASSSTSRPQLSSAWEVVGKASGSRKPANLGRRGKSASVDSIASTANQAVLRQVTASVPVGSKERDSGVFVPVQLNGPAEKLPIPRMVPQKPPPKPAPEPSPKISENIIAMPQQKLSLVLRKKYYKPIQPKPDKTKSRTEDTAAGSTVSAGEAEKSDSTNRPVDEGVKFSDGPVSDGEKTIKLEDALSDYFHGGHNSQEQEEELMRYFQHQTSSSSNEELEEVLNPPKRSATADPTKSDQLSQLRLLLERNLTNVAQPSVGLQRNPAGNRPATVTSVPTEDLSLNDDVFLAGPSSHLRPGASASASLSMLSQRNQQMQHQKHQQQVQAQQGFSHPVQQQKHGLLPSLLTAGHNTAGLSARRRVSFETSVTEHYQQESAFQNAVPPSPNTRRRFFNFTPISAGPQSPIIPQRPPGSSKPSSANASPFVSPRNTPVPRNRHAIFPAAQQTTVVPSSRARLPAKVVRSNSVSSSVPSVQCQPPRPRALSTTAPLLQTVSGDLVMPQIILSQQSTVSSFSGNDSLKHVPQFSSLPGELQLSAPSVQLNVSLSAPQSPMASTMSQTVVSCTTEDGAEFITTAFELSDMLASQDKSTEQQFNSDTNFFSDNTDTSLQLNLSGAGTQQQVPLPTPDPLAHEVSQFFPDDMVLERTALLQQQQQQHFQYRSQSVPLHRMSTADAPVSTHYSIAQPGSSGFTLGQYSSSAASSVAPTPVPSECMDFGGIADNSNNAALSMEISAADTEGLNSENLNRIFNILDDAQAQQKQEEAEQQEQQQSQEVGLTLDLVAAQSINHDFGEIRQSLHSSRSYPNTPVPYKSAGLRDPMMSAFAIATNSPENSPSILSSRSLPPTPILTILEDDGSFQTIEDRDPMLTLSALNSQLSDDGSAFGSRLDDPLNLDPLDLQECDTFSQLAEVDTGVSDT